MIKLENKTYQIYENSFKVDEKNIKFYGNIKFDIGGVLPFIDSGSNCDVYVIRVGEHIYALKVYVNTEDENLKTIEDKLNWDIDLYITPIRVMYINGKFSGYLMKLCKGKSLEYRKLSISIKEFEKGFIKLYDDSKQISRHGYIIDDLYTTNILYDNGFKIIDTDDYIKVDSNFDIEQLEKINIKKLNQLMANVFAKNANLENMIFSDSRIQKLLSEGYIGNILFDELFKEICSITYDKADEKLNNIGDIGKVLVKSKVGKRIELVDTNY